MYFISTHLVDWDDYITAASTYYMGHLDSSMVS